jgi:hypothetical protein
LVFKGFFLFPWFISRKAAQQIDYIICLWLQSSVVQNPSIGIFWLSAQAFGTTEIDNGISPHPYCLPLD